MLTNFKLLSSVVLLLVLLVMPVFSFQPSGGVLMLDGEDDYAILPLAEHGYIFPRGTDEFTVEVWFYPKVKPEPGESNIILSQQVRFGLLQDNKCRGRIVEKDQMCSYGSAYLEDILKAQQRMVSAALMLPSKRTNGTIWQSSLRTARCIWHTTIKSLEDRKRAF